MNNTKTQKDDKSFYSTELNKTVEVVKEDFKRILEDSRTELETFYQSNLEKLEIENKKREEAHEKDQRSASEIVLLKSFRVNFTDDLTRLKDENLMLEKRYQEMNRRLEEIRESNRKAIDERQDLIDDLKTCVGEQMEQLRVLKAGRVVSPIESELKIYRKLLDIGHQSLQKTHDQAQIIPAIEPPVYVYDSKVRNIFLLYFLLILFKYIFEQNYANFPKFFKKT